MLIGHYAPALLLKAGHRESSLAQMFVATQLVDYGWALCNLVGLEHARVVPGFTESNDLDLYYMPYTHSLLATLVWSILAGALSRAWSLRQGKTSWLGPVVIALCVASHFFTDLLVHSKDLPIASGVGSKLGLGLWHQRNLAFGLELFFFAGAAALYLRRTTWTTEKRWAPWVLLTTMLLVTVYSYFGPHPSSVREINLSAPVLYTGLAVLALYCDRQRT